MLTLPGRRQDLFSLTIWPAWLKTRLHGMGMGNNNIWSIETTVDTFLGSYGDVLLNRN